MMIPRTNRAWENTSTSRQSTRLYAPWTTPMEEAGSFVSCQNNSKTVNTPDTCLSLKSCVSGL